jgi:hypothetical protein
MGWIALLKRWANAEVVRAEIEAANAAGQHPPVTREHRIAAISLAPIWLDYWQARDIPIMRQPLADRIDLFLASHMPRALQALPAEERHAVLFAAIVLSGTHAEAEVRAAYIERAVGP